MKKKVRLFAAMLLTLCAGVAEAAERRKVIIDNDGWKPGDNNIMAAIALIQDPTVEVVGITIVTGDGWQKEAVSQYLRMLEIIGRTDIPVVGGATYPLINTQAFNRQWQTLHGRLGYNGAWTESWPGDNTVEHNAPHGPDEVPPSLEGPPSTRPHPETAAEFLVRQVRAHPGKISIIAVGPFTNIATAVAMDARFAPNVRELWFQGGSFNPRLERDDEFTRQYLHMPRGSFNIRFDPEAARIMLRAPWKKLLVFPRDSTTDPRLSAEMVERLKASGSVIGQYIARNAHVGLPIWDSVLTVVFDDPGLITETTRLAMDVDIDHGANYGSTLSWMPENQPHQGEPTVDVVTAVDRRTLEDRLVKLLLAPTPKK